MNVYGFPTQNYITIVSLVVKVIDLLIEIVMHLTKYYQSCALKRSAA